MRHDSKSLVRRTIKRQAADRIPVGELCIDDAVVAAFTGISRVGFAQRRQVADRLGLDLICLGADYGPQNGGSALPAADAVGLNAVRQWAKQTDRFIFVLLDGGFQWGLKRWGFQKFLTMAMRRSADVSDLLQHVETLNRRLVTRAADLGADGVVIADDIAYQRGLLLPPDRIKNLFLPSLARQAEACHAAGLAVFFHSDGNLNAVLEDIAGSGFDGLQCIESAAGMDLAAIKADYGHKLCFWGNLDPACLVEALSAEALDARVEAVLASGARDGGLIFGTSSGLFEGMQPGNIERAYKCVRKKGEDHARS
jgi:uroporphyrinogen decarboxylase